MSEAASDQGSLLSSMKACWVVALVLTALLLGTSFSHMLELPAKMTFDGQLYVTLQKTLYVAWGPPHIGWFLEPATLVAAAVLAVLIRRRKPAVYLVVVAMSALFAAFPVLFFLLVEPANSEFRRMTADALPPHWMSLRMQWEYGHAARFVLHLLGFCLLVFALLYSRKGRRVVAPGRW